MVKPMYKDPPETADDFLMKKLADILDEEKKNDIGVANTDDIIQAILYADKTKVKPPLAGREIRAEPQHIKQISTEPKSDISNILVPATPVVPGTQPESDMEVDNPAQRNSNDALAVTREVKAAPRFSGLKEPKRPMRTGSIISVKSQTRDVVGFLDDLLESAPLPEYAIRDTQKTTKAQISAFDQSSQISKFNSQTQRVNKSESQAFSLKDHLGLSTTGSTRINASESADVDMDIGSPQVAKLHTPKRQKTFNVVETLLDSLDNPNISEQASIESSSEVKVFRPPGQSVTVPPSSSESTPLKPSISIPLPSGTIIPELKPKAEKKLSKMEQLKIQKQKENEINSLVEQEEYEEILNIKPEELKGVCQVEFADLVVNRRPGKNVENHVEETSVATNRPQGMAGYANYFQQTLHLRDGKVVKDFRRFKKSPSKKLPRIIEVVPASHFNDTNTIDSDDEVPRTKLKSKLKKESPDRTRSRQDHSQPELDVDTYNQSPEKRIDDYDDDEFISRKDVKLKTVKDRNQLAMIVNNKVKVKTESPQPPSQVPSLHSQHSSQRHRQRQQQPIPLTSSSSSQKQSKLNFTKLQPKLARRQLRSLESSSSSDNDDDEILNVDHEGIGLDQSTVSSSHSSNITQPQPQKDRQKQKQHQTPQQPPHDSQIPNSGSQNLNTSSHGTSYSLGKGIQALRAKKEESRMKRRKMLSSDDDESN
ncbi:hypothetical protein BKA69DRAFT_884208 [Paraphysoderma sedebokerense]|nr:hypothetical protein BKA69DRAFT_884208 [Paraphysoderma sedebokerense]